MSARAGSTGEMPNGAGALRSPPSSNTMGTRVPKRRAGSLSGEAEHPAKRVRGEAQPNDGGALTAEKMMELLYRRGAGWQGKNGLDSVLISVGRDEAGSAITDILAATRDRTARDDVVRDNILAFGWDRFLDMFSVDHGAGERVWFVGPGGELCKIETESDWRALLWLFHNRGVPIAASDSFPVARFQVRATEAEPDGRSTEVPTHNTVAGDTTPPDAQAMLSVARVQEDTPVVIDITDDSDDEGEGEPSQLLLAEENEAGGTDTTAPAARTDTGGSESDSAALEPTLDDPINFSDCMRDFPEAKSFFGYLPGTGPMVTNRDVLHQVTGLKQGIRDYQLPAIWRQLHCKVLTGRFAILNADAPGLGKTFEVLAAWWIASYLLPSMWEEVKKDRADGGARHLKRSATGGFQQPADAECPSGTHKHGIPCPCVERAGGYQLVKSGICQPGYLLMLGPPQIVQQNLSAALAMFDEDDDPFKSPAPLKVYYVGGGKADRTKVERASAKELCDRHWCDSTEPTEVNDLASMTVSLRPAKSMARTIIGMNATSGLQTVEKTATYRWAIGDNRTEVLLHFPLQPAWIVLDEAHKIKGRDTIPAQFIRMILKRSHTPVVFTALSGTPVDKGPQDLDCFFNLVFDDSLQQGGPGDGKQKQEALAECQRMYRRLEGHTDSPNYTEDLARYQAELTSLIQPLTIRRLQAGMFGGRRILDLPEVTEINVTVEQSSTNAQLNEMSGALHRKVRAVVMKNLEKQQELWDNDPDRQGSRPTADQVAKSMFERGRGRFWLLQTASALPALLRHANAVGKPWDFSGSDADNIRGDDLLLHITEGSAKIQKVIEVVRSELETVPTRVYLPPGRDELKSKVIVTCNAPLCARAVASRLRRELPAYETSLYDSSVAPGKRAGILGPFQRSPYVFDEGDDEVRDPRILVTTSGLASEGLNLQRCNAMVFVETTRQPYIIEQSKGRIVRSGQTAACRVYHIHNDGNAADKIALAMLEHRAIVNDVWSVGDA